MRRLNGKERGRRDIRKGNIELAEFGSKGKCGQRGAIARKHGRPKNSFGVAERGRRDIL